MRLMRGAVVGADAVGQFLGGKQAIGRDDGPRAMRPRGCERIEPGTRAGHEAGEKVPAAVRFGVLVVDPEPGAPLVTDLPTGIVPDQ